MAYPSYYYGHGPYRPFSKREKIICACIPVAGWYLLACDQIGKKMRDETLAIGERMWERAKNGTFDPSFGLRPPKP